MAYIAAVRMLLQIHTVMKKNTTTPEPPVSGHTHYVGPAGCRGSGDAEVVWFLFIPWHQTRRRRNARHETHDTQLYWITLSEEQRDSLCTKATMLQMHLITEDKSWGQHSMRSAQYRTQTTGTNQDLEAAEEMAVCFQVPVDCPASRWGSFEFSHN